MSTIQLPFVDLFRRHPAFLLTAVYLLVSAIGLMFSWAFFRHFDVNYFMFADVTDFLLAAVREPVSLIAAASGLLVMWLLYRYANWELKVIGARPHRGRLLEIYYRYNRWAIASPWVALSVIVLYMFLLISVFAEWRAYLFQEGWGPEVALRIGDAEPVRLQLMGSSARFIFLYDADGAQTVIVPDESITTLVVPQ